MTRQRFGRRWAIGAAALVAAVGLPVVHATPASSLEQAPIVIGPNDRLEIDYDPILVPNPANEADDPETCKSAPYCFTIPLKLNRPADLKPDDEFTIRIRMSWQVDVEDVEAPALGEVTSNDMDLKIWNAPYVAEDERGEPTEPANTGGATSAQPEKTSLNTPPKDDYFLVVTNFVGANRGFKLTLSWDPEVFPTPFEDLGGTSAGPRDLSADTAPITPSFSAPDSGLSEGPASPSFRGPSSLIGLNPAAIDPSVGFDAGSFATPSSSPLRVDTGGFIDGEGASDLDADLIDEARRLTARPAAAFGPAKPVAGGIVAFWLIFVPLVLLFGVGAYLIRRRPAALSFS